LITLPSAALVGGVSAAVVKHGGNAGTVVIALVAAAVAAFIVVASRRNPVHAHNVNDSHEVTVRATAPTSVGTAA
jgi:PiT family inorganic phosphate transporter